MIKLNSTTYQQLVKDNPKDRLEVEVGDSKQPDFKPQVKFMRWNNEVNFSMRAQEEAGAKVKELPDGTIVYEAKEYEVHQYDKPDASEEGGFEFEWVLKSKPASNVLTATISTKGLDFFYQPALTPKEIAEGASRPPEVIGSYAVYHSTKGGMNDAAGMEYKVGKFCHIYRPKAIDANGVEVWADLVIENGVLSVTVPQKFLDDAVYPVRVDPTVGYTTDGASGSNFDNNSPNGNKKFVVFTAPENGTIDSATFATRFEVNSPNTAKFKAAIYKVSDASLLSPQSAEQTTITWNGWTTATFSSGPSIVSGTNYYIAGFGIETTGPSNPGMYIEYDTGASSNKFINAVADAAWPNPHETLSATTFLYSLYATYTASGGTAIKDIIGGGFIMFPR